MGKPKKHEKVRAKSDTFNESQMISYKSGSNEKTKLMILKEHPLK